MPERSEKAEERLCDQLIAKLGGQIVRFSHPGRTMQTPGIPDRRYRLYGLAFWWEVKRTSGRLSEAQVEFLRAELEAGDFVGCGDLNALVVYVECLRESRIGALKERALIEHWSRTPAQRRAPEDTRKAQPPDVLGGKGRVYSKFKYRPDEARRMVNARYAAHVLRCLRQTETEVVAGILESSAKQRQIEETR